MRRLDKVLPTPPTIRNLQRKLYQKAKSEPEFRFYALYDKVYRPDILAHAYKLVKENRGAPGVDGVTFRDVQESGVEELLAELAEELRTETYRPLPVRRKYIPKPYGKGERPLGIPTIRDRVVQQAAKLVLDPIFEADMPENMYAYRPKRQAHQAIRRVHRLLKSGYAEVVDADVSKYFDTIPHPELMRSVARRISDGKVLRLIKLWLKTPVEDLDGDGKPRLSGGKDHDQGVPQGGVISPLLANIYMRRFLLAWKSWGLEQRLGAYVVNYADDFVIVCRRGAQRAQEAATTIFERLKLALNGEKTQVVRAGQQPFDFLGYTFATCYAVGSGRPYLGAQPARRRVRRIYSKIRELLSPWNQAGATDVVRRVNQRLRGWSGYYSYGTLTPAYRLLDGLVVRRLRAWLCRRAKADGRGTRRYPDQRLYQEFGLMNLVSTLAAKRRSKARGEASPRAGCGKTARPVR